MRKLTLVIQIILISKTANKILETTFPGFHKLVSLQNTEKSKLATISRLSLLLLTKSVLSMTLAGLEQVGKKKERMKKPTNMCSNIRNLQ